MPEGVVTVRYLLLCAHCEPGARLTEEELLRAPYPHAYVSFYREAVGICPKFTRAIDPITLAIGYTNGSSFLIDTRSTYHSAAVLDGTITEVNEYSLPYSYRTADHQVEVYQGTDAGRPVLAATITRRPGERVILTTSDENVFIAVFSESLGVQAAQMVVRVQRMRSMDPGTEQAIIIATELEVAAVAIDEGVLVAIDSRGVLMVGVLADLLVETSDSRVLMSKIHTRHLSLSDAIPDYPVACAFSNSLGLIVVGTSLGKLYFFDASLTDLCILSPENNAIDLRELLSIRPTIFSIAIINRQVIVVPERSLPLVINLLNISSQDDLFLSRLMGLTPQKAVWFNITAAEAIEDALKHIVAAKEEPSPTQDLDKLFLDALGQDALSYVRAGAPDLRKQRLLVVAQHEHRILRTGREALTSKFLATLKHTVSLLLSVHLVEFAIPLVLQLRTRRQEDARPLSDALFRSIYSHCLENNLTTLCAALSTILDDDIRGFSQRQARLREQRLGQSAEATLIASSVLNLAISKLLNGSVHEAMQHLDSLSLSRVIDLTDISEFIRGYTNDLARVKDI
ncbi:hypothetical protein GMRT_10499 [Giardia muris]|uniref:Uncharacterized protein n=1 Tax=Giardia muris TaxID=5742 RepID=A0A4Z1SLT9_GIAMU|nr:hypothetical protein GMRT_10499 [Giardia muris]|eukprot:TNJ26510.1 hypothetical protein GMRT_10499 [Giardia muris]